MLFLIAEVLKLNTVFDIRQSLIRLAFHCHLTVTHNGI